MKFAFMGYSVEQSWTRLSPGEMNAMFEECFAYDTALLREGYMLNEGAALQPSRKTKTLRWQDGTAVVVDGPNAETKEQLGGMGVLEARDMAHAVELFSKHPGLRFGVAFEIRPIDEEMLKRQAENLAKLGSRAPVNPSAVKVAALGYHCDGGNNPMPKEEFEAMVQRCIDFDQMRVKNGQWLSGIKLQSTRLAKTLRASAGNVVVTDGPFAETKESLGGLVVLAVKNVEEAIALLSTHPALAFGVVMEIRPIDAATTKRWEALQAAVV